MPYHIVFEKPFAVTKIDDYVNPCCWGGDVVVRRLLPIVEGRYRDIQANQDERGWFIWFREGIVALAIDVQCEDPETGRFLVRLTGRTRKWVVSRVADGPELDALADAVVAQLSSWPVSGLTTARVDAEPG
jgi:hypothetical protein